MTIHKFDNVVSENAYQNLTQAIFGLLPLTLSPIVARDTLDINEKLNNNIQFSHFFYLNHQPQGEHIGLLKELIDFLKPLAIIRIRLNITLPTEKIIKHDLHWDAADSVYNNNSIPLKNCTNSIYYLNTNNGYTFFEDGTKYISKGNSLITFNNSLKHSGTTCTDAAFRAVLNFCYVAPEK